MHSDEGSSAMRKKGGYCRTSTISENMHASAKADHRLILPQHKNSISRMMKTIRQ